MGIAVVLTAAAAISILTLSLSANATRHAQNTNSSTSMNSNMSQNSNMNRNSNMGGGSMMLSSDDRKFMMEAAMGGMAEVEAARVAVQKSSMDSVKQYAQQMIDDHTRAGDELKQLASAKGVILPATLDAKHTAMIARMQGMSGMEFDRMYIREMGVKAHEKMEKLFMRESTRGRDGDTKAFAAKTLPVVRMHLTMGRDMANRMKGTHNNSNSNSSGGNSNMNM
jgi:putative membrane protein